MIKKRLKAQIIITTIAFLALGGCKKEQPLNSNDPVEADGFAEIKVSEHFNWSTTQQVSCRIKAVTNEGAPMRNVKFSIYNGDPASNGKLLIAGATDQSGEFSIDYKFPSYLESVFIETDYIGLPHGQSVPVTNGQVSLYLGGGTGSSQSLGKSSSPASVLNATPEFRYMGGWNSNGVPSYLLPQGDVIDQAFLDDVNSSLPERNPVPTAHPQYLSSGMQTNTVLSTTADVWVTFVHEGAGWRNGLGYYTYNVNNPPDTPEGLDSLVVIFPNVSYAGSGGGLHSGDKVLLGTFPKDTVIGWFIVANGWSNQTLGTGHYVIYSNPEFNPEPDPALRQHNVLLSDPGRDLLLLGFEDVRRDQLSCDQDFNDAIFYISANPPSALQTNAMPTMDYTSTSDDTDNDGISNTLDQFPDDADRAFESYYPAESVFGTLAFEDLWPGRGDYDFNDLVIGYNFKSITNSENKVIEIESTFIIQAVGASYSNGFGFEMPISPDLVASVTGNDAGSGYITLDANNLEAGQDNAVVIVFDDAHSRITRPGGYFINTEYGAPYVEPDTITVRTVFATPISQIELGTAPFNPFVISNKRRGHEIHLPDHAPTTLADLSLLGTSHDNSNSSISRFYKTHDHLPWAIDIPEPFSYPQEKNDIINAHIYMSSWAQSNGDIYRDWYKSEAGYRNTQKIYSR